MMMSSGRSPSARKLVFERVLEKNKIETTNRLSCYARQQGLESKQATKVARFTSKNRKHG